MTITETIITLGAATNAVASLGILLMLRRTEQRNRRNEKRAKKESVARVKASQTQAALDDAALADLTGKLGKLGDLNGAMKVPAPPPPAE